MNIEDILEFRKVGIPKVLLYIGERSSRSNFNGGGTWNTGVRDEEVNVAGFFGNMRGDALQVVFGACVTLQRDNIAVLLPSYIRTQLLCVLYEVRSAYDLQGNIYEGVPLLL